MWWDEQGIVLGLNCYKFICTIVSNIKWDHLHTDIEILLKKTILRLILQIRYVGPYGTSYFSCPLYFFLYSLLSLSYFLLAFPIHLCVVKTLVQKVHISYSHTEWYLLFFLCKRSENWKPTPINLIRIRQLIVVFD